MNSTDDISSIYGVCKICQISHGFSSADQRALIILIVIATIAFDHSEDEEINVQTMNDTSTPTTTTTTTQPMTNRHEKCRLD
ncbi:hypothetical protein I4U23_018783 [Adineta vaga]|nr:hypothetical protein I4U23_018783 [Adineta vaga]